MPAEHDHGGALPFMALREGHPAWGGIWLEWLQYAATRADRIPGVRIGYDD